MIFSPPKIDDIIPFPKFWTIKDCVRTVVLILKKHLNLIDKLELKSSELEISGLVRQRGKCEHASVRGVVILDCYHQKMYNF